VKQELALRLLSEFRDFCSVLSAKQAEETKMFCEPKVYGKGSNDYSLYFRKNELSSEALNFLKCLAEKYGLVLSESEFEGYVVLCSYEFR
jgi:hypothetical protein